MNSLFVIILILSLICLLYYIIIITYAGRRASFSLFWLIAGLLGLAVSDVIYFMMLHEIALIWVFHYIILGGFLLGGTILLSLEVILVSHASEKGVSGLNYIIILGAQVRGLVITKSLKKRLNKGLEYLANNPDTLVIVSGGQGKGEDISEAEAMRNYLISKGITPKQIIKEDRSRNTFENILYSKRFIKSGSSVGIVTNGFHIFRAKQLAKKQGLIKVYGIAAPTDVIMMVNYYTREAFSVIKDKIVGNI